MRALTACSGQPRTLQCSRQASNDLQATTIRYLRSSAHDTIVRGKGAEADRRGNDTIFGEEGYDSLWGNSGDDLLDGGHDSDILMGGSGSDVLLGQAGSDLLQGASGRDRLIGGSGFDFLDGGREDDLLIAGTTSYDQDQTALNAVMAEWNSAARINNVWRTSAGVPKPI